MGKIRYEDLVEGDKFPKVGLDEDRIADKYYEKPLGPSHSDGDFRERPRYEFNRQYVSKFENVQLIGPDAIPISNNGKIIAEAIETTRENEYRLNQALLRTITDESTLRKYISGEYAEYPALCSLTTCWDNYYHWMLEHLPKLRAVEKAKQHWDIDPQILIPSNPPSYVTESLYLMGYDHGSWIEHEAPIIQSREYIQPTFTEPTKQVCSWLRSRALQNLSEKVEMDKSRRVYVSRRKAEGRNIVNETQVESLLHDFGFCTYTTEDLTVPEQVHLFKDADVVVSPHGAGLTDIIWSDDITVIEIFNNVSKPPYYQIAEELGHEYHALRGQSIGNRGYDSDIYVKLEDLANILESDIY